LGLGRVSDGSCEMAAFPAYITLACVAHRSEPVPSLFRHIAMLHCPRMVHAGGAPIDRYVVLEHLSEGGMGAIYVGKKMGAGGFEMEVVLKQLLPEFTQQEEFIDLFLREAKLSATLDHANIVHTIDLVTAGGEYFIVMEYLPGGDLRTLLKKAKRRGKRFSPSAAIYICREVASALSYAHSKRDFNGQPLKLIHRDVSPSNVLLSNAGEVKLTDFGIAKAATHTSLFYKVKGKIGYMSPEQAKSESLDHRSDLYSLAVCFYEILTGERLFVAAGLTTSADEIYSQPVPQITKKVAGLPADLDAIMAKALAIDPAKRYQTAGELQEALMRCAHRNGLLMSAPELAKELQETCGPPDAWRGEDDEEDPNEPPRAGTEVYDALDDDDDDDDDGEDVMPIRPSGPLSVQSIAARARSPVPKSPIPQLHRPKTEVDRFAGVELTSIINMMDLDDQQGSKPLVDLNAAPNIDSGPSVSLDSGPRPMPTGPRTLDSDPGLNAFVNSLTQPGIGPPPAEPIPSTKRHVAPPMPGPSQTHARPPGPSQTHSRPPGPSQNHPMPSDRPYTPPPLGLDDMLPTAPRRAPSYESRPPAEPTARTRPKPPSSSFALKPWMVIVALILVGGIAALVVALSGPNVPSGK
jgi:serine/threonine protein kinase